MTVEPHLGMEAAQPKKPINSQGNKQDDAFCHGTHDFHMQKPTTMLQARLFPQSTSAIRMKHSRKGQQCQCPAVGMWR